MADAAIVPGDVTLAVLAGGEGSRMGFAKGLLKLGDQFILEYLADRLDWPGPTLLITAPGREHPPGAARFARELIDPVAGAGPLRGVLTALEQVSTPLLIATALDMPLVERAHLAWLAASLAQAPDALGAMCARPVEGRSQVEPFPCALRREAKRPVGEALAAGSASIYGLTKDARFVVVSAPVEWPPEMWTNLNRREDWEGFVGRSGS